MASQVGLVGQRRKQIRPERLLSPVWEHDFVGREAVCAAFSANKGIVQEPQKKHSKSLWPSLSLFPLPSPHTLIHTPSSLVARPSTIIIRSFHSKVIRPALLLRPLIIVRLGMLLHDLLVVAGELFAAESADGHLLLGFDRRAVGVDFDASAGGVGLLVLAGHAVFFGDGHVCCLL